MPACSRQAPLSLCLLLLPLLLLLLYLCKRLVDSSPYLAFHPFLPEAALGRQIIKISISFYAGQRSLLCFTEQGLFQFGLAACLGLPAAGRQADRSGFVVVSRALAACRCAR